MYLSLWTLISAAYGFCGAFVAPEGETITNRTSHVILAKQGDQTFLTMENDFEGASADFGILIPVSPSFSALDLRVLRGDDVASLRAYTEPRVVAYTCGDLFGVSTQGPAPSSARACEDSECADSGDSAEEEDSGAQDSAGDSAGDDSASDSGAADSAGDSAGDDSASDSGPADSDDSDLVETGDPGRDTGSRPAPEPRSYSGGCWGPPPHAAQEDPTWVDDVDDGVDVESRYVVGEYEAFELSSDSEDALEAWLFANGFSLPESARGAIRSLIDEGQSFLALRVQADLLDPTNPQLSPVQLRSDGPGLVLPLRLGATASGGVQEVLLHVLTSSTEGRAAIANYPEATVPSECMRSPGEEPFPTWYDARLTDAMGLPADPAALTGQSAASWTLEYAFPDGKCDPCADGSFGVSNSGLSPSLIAALGGDPMGYFATRLRLRFTPDAVTTDALVYTTGDTTMRQQRYVAWEHALESMIPYCDGTIPEAPGTCFGADYWAERAETRAAGGEVEGLRFSNGCAGGRALMFGLLPLMLWRRRR